MWISLARRLIGFLNDQVDELDDRRIALVGPGHAARRFRFREIDLRVGELAEHRVDRLGFALAVVPVDGRDDVLAVGERGWMSLLRMNWSFSIVSKSFGSDMTICRALFSCESGMMWFSRATDSGTISTTDVGIVTPLRSTNCMLWCSAIAPMTSWAEA